MLDAIGSRLDSLHVETGVTRLEKSTIYQALALTGILLFAAVLRFYKLGEWSFWIDEVLEIGYAQEAVNSFPFYPGLRVSLLVIAAALNLFGVSEWSARLAPALVGLLTLPVLYFPIRRLFGPFVALLAVLFLAISPWHLFWSQNARFYTFLLLFYTLGQLAFFFWLETNRFVYLVVAGLMLGLAALERMVAAFIAPAVLVYFIALFLLKFEKPIGLTLRNLALLAAPAVIFGLYQVFVDDFLGDFSFWILGHQHDPVRVGLSIIYDTGLPLFLLAMLGGLFLVLQKSRPGLYLFLGALVPCLILVAIAPFTQAFSRYVFMVLPSFAILAAIAAREILTSARGQMVVLAVFVLLAPFADAMSQNVLYYSFQNGNRENFKAAFAQVAAQKAPGDVIYSTRERVGDYYMDEDILASQDVKISDLNASTERKWFVMDNRSYISPALQNWLDTRAELKGVYDVYIPGKVMTMRVYLHDPGDP